MRALLVPAVFSICTSLACSTATTATPEAERDVTTAPDGTSGDVLGEPDAGPSDDVLDDAPDGLAPDGEAPDGQAPDAGDEPLDGAQGPDASDDATSLDVVLGPDPAEGLSIGHLQVKGTHNSYHIEPPDNQVPDWDYTMAPLGEQLATQGVRQVELDVHLDDAGVFHVHHIPVLDSLTTCDLFLDCLGELKTWSDAHPGHHVLFVLIEPKDDLDLNKITDYEALDAALTAVWPRDRIVAPDDVRGSYPTLREALNTVGWPSIAATRGKVMFVMLDEGAHRDAYLDGRPSGEGRLIFSRGGQDAAFGAVLEIGREKPEAIKAAATAGYLVRTTVNSTVDADAVMAAGAHLISTDHPSADTAADDGFSLALPGGSPSRCNPVTAPESCNTAALELP